MEALSTQVVDKDCHVVDVDIEKVIYDIQNQIRQLDDEYYQQLIPKQHALQNALRQLQRDKLQLLNQEKNFTADDSNSNEYKDQQVQEQQLPSTTHQGVLNVSPSNTSTPDNINNDEEDAVAARLAQALFQDDDDDDDSDDNDSSSSSSSDDNPFI